MYNKADIFHTACTNIIFIGASVSKPHTGQSFVLSTIHKKLLTTAYIFVRVMVHDMMKVTAQLQYFHICSCNGS